MKQIDYSLRERSHRWGFSAERIPIWASGLEFDRAISANTITLFILYVSGRISGPLCVPLQSDAKLRLYKKWIMEKRSNKWKMCDFILNSYISTSYWRSLTKYAQILCNSFFFWICSCPPPHKFGSWRFTQHSCLFSVGILTVFTGGGFSWTWLGWWRVRWGCIFWFCNLLGQEKQGKMLFRLLRFVIMRPSYLRFSQTSKKNLFASYRIVIVCVFSQRDFFCLKQYVLFHAQSKDLSACRLRWYSPHVRKPLHGYSPFQQIHSWLYLLESSYHCLSVIFHVLSLNDIPCGLVLIR